MYGYIDIRMVYHYSVIMALTFQKTVTITISVTIKLSINIKRKHFARLYFLLVIKDVNFVINEEYINSEAF